MPNIVADILQKLHANDTCCDSVNRDLAVDADNFGMAAFAYSSGPYDQVTMTTCHQANEAGLLHALLGLQSRGHIDRLEHVMERLIPLNRRAIEDMANAYALMAGRNQFTPRERDVAIDMMNQRRQDAFDKPAEPVVDILRSKSANQA